MATEYYCTYFDHRYAAQGLAMIRSLREHGGDQPVWVFCLSPEAGDLVRSFDVANITAIPLSDLEQHFTGLADAKLDRSLIEYYFTLTPFVVRYVFDKAPNAQRVAYLDGDLFFFSDVTAMWKQSVGAPAVIIPHNFSPRAKHLSKYGLYNVGWVGFDRSEEGQKCLCFWQDRCREWCRDIPDNGRFADQGYLNQFSEIAPNLRVIEHKGCNVAPWNVSRHRIRLDAGRVVVGNDPLVFFHFTGFKRGLFGRWFNAHRMYRSGTSHLVKQHIYRPYLHALASASEFVDPLLAQNAPADKTLARNRGGAIPLKQRAYQWVNKAGQLYDFLTGKSLADPLGRH